MSSYDTGATFSQWIRASMSEELDEKKMHAAACLRMLGVEGEAPFGACADVTADQREEARKYFVSAPFPITCMSKICTHAQRLSITGIANCKLLGGSSSN
jgi:hypothetical protein